MLRIHQITSAARAKSYYAQADYYGQELIGEWGGKTAERLGLNGPVTLKAFNSLCDNRDPRTGQLLTARQRSDRTVAYDFNFNAPKGVGVLYSLTGDERVLEAFRRSVKDTMQELEADAKTRVRKGGLYENRTTGELAWAEFIHFTARMVDGECDPSLHGHIVVQNVTFDKIEDRMKAVQFRGLKADAPYWQAAFHARLAENLEAIGYATERRGKSWDVTCVSRLTVERFSRRTKEIEDAAKELGLKSAEAKAKLGATTRDKKDTESTWPELVARWRERMTELERKAIERARKAAIRPRAKVAGAERESMKFATEHLYTRKSTVNYRDLLAEGLRHGVGRVSVAGIAKEAGRMDLILVQDGERLKATWKLVLQEEKKLKRIGRQGRGTKARLGRKGGGGPARETLSADQLSALDKMLKSTDFITLFEAPAGAGKTKTATALREAIRETGRPLVAVAPSAKASRGVLRDEKFDNADTLKMFIDNKKFQATARDGVIFVDEAGMVGVPTMLRLADIAKELNARIVMCGDRWQHHAIERGDALRLLADEAKLPVAALTENWRQMQPEYKEAIKHFRQGDSEKGLNQLDALKWVEEHEGQALYDRAAELYCQWRVAAKNPAKDILAVSPTHAEADQATAAIRKRLKAEEILGEERTFDRLIPLHLTEAEKTDRHSYSAGDVLQFHKAAPKIKPGTRIQATESNILPLGHAERFSVFRASSIKLAPGDLIQFTANGKTLDEHRLNNGDVFAVKGFTEAGNIELANGWVVGKQFKHWNHGYLSTSYSSQGRTVDRVLIVQSALSAPASNQTQAYVTASRGREMAMVLTDSKESLKDATAREDRRMSALELTRRKRSNWRQRMMEHVLRLGRLAEHTRIWGPAQEHQHQRGMER
jgi:conjugative relaxase-like TrwC/TraI family protein